MLDLEYTILKLLKAAKRKTPRGAINDIIDLIFHPFFGKTLGVAELLDFLFHSLNEQRIDLIKFAKYNLSSFVFSILDALERMKKMGKVSPRGKRRS